MIEIKSYIQKLFAQKELIISDKRQPLFEEFIQNESNQQAVKTIIEQQNYLMDKWKLKNRIEDIIALQILIPNATESKEYNAEINFEKLGLNDLIFEEWQGLEEIGLQFDKETDTIKGVPNQNGELKFKLLFKVIGEDENSEPNEKPITLIVNPDPKTLWRNIPSDKEALFWKEDDAKAFGKLGEKHIVVASNRGRSHENVGSFRDDDFAFKFIEKTGWSVVAVSDGAGSYPLSRKGSELACNAVVDYFENHLDKENFLEFENKLLEFSQTKEGNLHKEIQIEAKQKLYKAVLFVHNQIKDLAEKTQQSNPELFNNPKAKSLSDYFHATLIFALFKKFDFGYVVLTFGVGDCPIAIMDKDQVNTSLLNTLDVGEFGGGTRFVTQSDIYQQDAKPLTMAQRFNMQIVTDFSYLFLMTDGIYDAKFVVEANLEKHEKWVEFLEDLQGNNEDNSKVNFNIENEKIADELARWMDFWSPGNHDDRTLAIIY